MWTLGDKYNVQTPERAAKELLTALSVYKPYIYKRSATRGSVYIHFDNLPNGLTHKLRVSDHEERERYGYKWQLRLDGVPVNRKPQRRYFDSVGELVKNFHRYSQRVEELNAELLNREEQTDADYQD